MTTPVVDESHLGFSGYRALSCGHEQVPFLAFPCHGGLVIGGQQLRDARVRRGWTQEQLAAEVNVTLRSIGNWERSRVPANREARIRDLLGTYLDGEVSGNPLASATDVALLAELGRRLDRAKRGGSTDDGRQPEAEKTPEPPPAVTDLGGRRRKPVPRIQDEAAREEGRNPSDR